MNKKSLHFIINPISGTGKQRGIEKKIETIIDAATFEVFIHYTAKKGHAIEIAKDLVANNAFMIVAVGGDGTVNEVAQTMVNSASILGIVPTGSGNGLARHLGIPQNTSHSLKRLNTLRTKQIDSCLANTSFFINVSGVGYDAHIAHCFAQDKRRGIQTYIKLILSEWWSYSVKRYRIVVNEGECFNGEAVQISFANGSQFGNNVVISPQSIADDGQIELCIVKPFKFYEVPSLFLALLTSRLYRTNKMEIITCSSAKIYCSNDRVHLDGEPSESTNSIALKVLPKSIRVLAV
jgi:YegS/Rv2252/BmrU family lipid kinase